MESIQLEQLRYPIGQFVVPDIITDEHIQEWIAVLDKMPQKFYDLTKDLDDQQLDSPYRPDGWTIRQVIHHVADSHHHSYIRFKWALTEDTPTIKPYLEKGWANLFDARTAPIELSLDHLKAVHAKLVYLLKGLSTSDLARTFIHPDDHATTSLSENIGRYSWHGSHHYAHIENLLNRKGWS